MSKTTPKKGVPRKRPILAEIERERERVSQMLEGLPKTNAVTHPARTPEERIRQLENTIAIYEREAQSTTDTENEIAELIDAMRLRLLKTCGELAPTAKRMAKKGKPALFRLIGRTVRSVR